MQRHSKFHLSPARERQRNQDLMRDWRKGRSYQDLSYCYDLPEHLVKYIVQQMARQFPADANGNVEYPLE